MAKRVKLSRQANKKIFKRGATRIHKKNLPAPRKMPMRGGIRM